MDNTDSLLEYAKKMLDRGDGYSSIIYYLDNKGVSPETRREIILKLDEYKKAKQANDSRRNDLYSVSWLKIAVGTAFFVLTLYLMKFNIIAFPWTLIGFAIGGRTLYEIIKIFINFFKS
ncbi:MAG: hypothetical protein LBD59_06660 [Prevotellaceae bacterium]|jgi:hypothetical protein|nr:hypothetical protein [Prevotellaceae bacterium]